MLRTLAAIQARLRAECHVSIAHADICGPWRACIETERNQWPHWVSFEGTTPEHALARLQGYLDGRVADHAKSKREPRVFMSEAQ